MPLVPDPRKTVPIGRLRSVKRSWDYSPGWVRAPLKEIVFNERLTKQARLLWLWLASVPNNRKNLSWGDCESSLHCGTKARRNCMSQLLEEGFISIDKLGNVILEDPYKVYKRTLQEIGRCRGCSFDPEEEPESLSEPKSGKNPEPDEAKPPTVSFEEKVIKTWNSNKPTSYASIRNLSKKQSEAIRKHCQNLGIRRGSEEDLIINVCKGITQSDFWMRSSFQHKNFQAIFGYGSPQDQKMKNVEAFFHVGRDGVESHKPKPVASVNQEEQELLDAKKFIEHNLSEAKARQDHDEVTKYQKMLNEVIIEIEQMGGESNE